MKFFGNTFTAVKQLFQLRLTGLSVLLCMMPSVALSNDVETGQNEQTVIEQDAEEMVLQQFKESALTHPLAPCPRYPRCDDQDSNRNGSPSIGS